jgi:curved DNA-binding protein CbpA
MPDGFSLDPYDVLGIGREASGAEVREAFRRRSKRHHPDLGGEEWAFRIVVWAYETIGAEQAAAEAPRLFRVGDVEDILRRAAPAPEPDPEPTEAGPVEDDWAAQSERVRMGVRDRDYPPTSMVLVDVIWMRYEVGDVRDLLGKTRGEDRNVSGSLHLRWPDPDEPEQGLEMAESPKILAELRLLYEWLQVRPDVVGSRLHPAKGRFEAWLTYPNGAAAWQAFLALRPALNGAGLGVRQRTRDLTIPRDR